MRAFILFKGNLNKYILTIHEIKTISLMCYMFERLCVSLLFLHIEIQFKII